MIEPWTRVYQYSFNPDWTGLVSSICSELTLAESTISIDDRSSHSLIKDIPLGILEPGQMIERVITLKSIHPGTEIIDFSLHTSPIASSSPSLAPPNSTIESDDNVEEINYTAVIPVLAPFSCSSTISYKRRDKLGEGFASVSSVVRPTGPRDIRVESITLQESVCQSLNLADATQGASEATLLGSSVDGKDSSSAQG
jgi:hypothetical protein